MPDFNPGPASTTTPNLQNQQSALPTTALTTFSALPAASTVEAGTLAYTSDQGLVVSNGASWNGVNTPSFFPTGAVGDGVTNDGPAIQAAINAASAAGGGTVPLAALTYYIPNGLQMKSGVWIRGQGATTNPSVSYNPNGGTWLLGNGTNPGIFWNNTPLAPGASQPSFATILATALKNVGIQNVGFSTFTRGIYCGELGNAGCLDGCFFINLVAWNCTQWGFYFENCVYAYFNNVRAFQMQAGAIGLIAHNVSTTNYNFGNCTHIEEGAGYNTSTVSNARGLVFNARAGAKHNDIVGHMVSCTTTDALIASSCTTNSTCAIQLPAGNAVNFPIDMPVVFNTGNTAPLLATNGWGGFPLSVTGNTNTNGLVAFFVIPFMLTANLTAVGTTFTLAGSTNNASGVWQGATGIYTVTFYLSDGTTSSQNLTLTNGSAGPYTITALGKAAWKQITITGTGGTKDYIQVSNVMRGIPIPSNVSTGANFIARFGFPSIECTAYDKATDPYNATGVNSVIQSASLGPCECEGFATAYILGQYGQHTITTNYMGGTGNQGTGYAWNFVFRGCTGSFSSNQGISVDTDNNTMQAAGIALNTTAAAPSRIGNKTPVGVLNDLQAGNPTAYLNLGQSRIETPFSLQSQSITGGSTGSVDALYPQSPLGQRTKTVTFQFLGYTLDGQYFCDNVYSFAGSGNVVSSPDTGTMQTLDATAGGSTGSSMAGMALSWANLSTNAMLLTNASGQNWNNVTNLTQVKVLPNGTFLARAQYNGTGTNGFWAVVCGDHIPYYSLNASNVIACGGSPRWAKIGTVTNATFSTAATSNKVGIFTLPIAGIIHAIRLNCTQTFTGGGLTTYTISVGNTGTVTKYMGANSVFTTGYFDAFLPGSESMSASTAIFANAIASGNLNLATQGSADIWALVSAAA